MAIVKATVGPSKDFTTLQAWVDDVKSSSNPAQHAECFGGGNLGTVAINDFTATPTASEHLRIYAAPGEMHDGQDTEENGAFIKIDGPPRVGIDNQEAHLEVDGIHFDIVNAASLTTTAILSRNDEGTSGREGRFLTVKNCQVRTQGGLTTTPAGIDYRDTDETFPAEAVLNAFNNMFWGQGTTGGTAIQAYMIAAGGLTVAQTMLIEIDQNTSYDFGNNGIVLISDKTLGFAAITLEVLQRNNAMVDHDNFDYLTFAIAGGGFDVTRTFSLSTDATADDEGGTGNLINKAAVDCFTTVGLDNTPKDGGELHDAGIFIPEKPLDMFRTKRILQGSAPDIGAIELIQLTPRSQSIIIA